MDSLIRRIAHYVQSDTNSFDEIANLPFKVEKYNAGQEIVVEGEKVDFVFVIESGWAIRFRTLDDGRRQILNFMLPGDCFDLMAVTRAKSDHNVSGASEVVLRKIKAKIFLETVANNPRLATSFWWAAIQEEAVLREQIIRVGRRSAKERTAHLILELNRRVSTVTGRLDDYLALPVAQALLADALGLSIVHVSRTLTRLKAEGYIRMDNKGIKIMRREDMAEMCDFDSRYLHLDKLKI